MLRFAARNRDLVLHGKLSRFPIAGSKLSSAHSMPSHVPRTDAAKKREQLAQRQQELEHTIRSEFPREQLVRAAEAVRAAHLSLFKAEIYWAEEAELAGRDVGARIANIERDAQRWTERSIEEILQEYSTT